MIERNFAQQILFLPISNGADELRIISGYSTPNMASWLIKNIQERHMEPISIKLILGMTPYNGISTEAHRGFIDLRHSHYPQQSKFVCSYVYDNPPVHSNLYVWLKNDCPMCAFVGSMDFLQSSFVNGRCELAEACDPQAALDYFNAVEARSIYCDSNDVEEYIIIRSKHPILDEESNQHGQLSGEGITQTTLSLLSREGNVGKKSGLNWGQRNKRNRNEAYIPLTSKIAKSGFFPLDKKHFMAKTDDGHNLILRVEQAGNKAITTPMSNALLGEYFRGRLGLANGSYISMQDLIAYGRTDVTFFKIDDEEYYMDFSVNKEA